MRNLNRATCDAAMDMRLLKPWWAEGSLSGATKAKITLLGQTLLLGDLEAQHAPYIRGPVASYYDSRSCYHPSGRVPRRPFPFPTRSPPPTSLIMAMMQK